MARVIAICGGKRCGKDTIAQHIAQTYGYEHIKISTKLKDMIGLLFGFTADQLETDLKDTIDDRWGISPRAAMQFLGTDIMQYEIQKLLPGVGRSFWIKGALESNKDAQRIVISDLRFLHEYRELMQMHQKKNDLFIMRVIRPDIVNADNHISEQEHLQIPVDANINNSGSIQDLLRAVDSALQEKVINQIGSHGDR